MGRISTRMIFIKSTGADQRKLFSSSCFQKADSLTLLGVSAISCLLAADSSLQPPGVGSIPCWGCQRRVPAGAIWGPSSAFLLPFPQKKRGEMQTDPLIFRITPQYNLVTVSYKNEGGGGVLLKVELQKQLRHWCQRLCIAGSSLAQKSVFQRLCMCNVSS